MRRFRFLVPKFCHWWDVKPIGGISFIFRGFHFHLLLRDLKLTPSFIFFIFFYFPIEWQEIQRGFQQLGWASEGDSPGNAYCK